MGVQVFPCAINELYVSWSDLAGTSYNVYRSGSPTGGFEKVADAISLPFFVDDKVDLYDEGNRYYYQVTGVTGGIESDRTEVATWEYNRPDGVANKVVQEAQVALRMMHNPIVHILIRNRVGAPCPDCWNPITQKVVYADCPTCRGTGSGAGYYPPIPTLISTDITQQFREVNLEDGDRVSLTPVNAWIANKPIVTPGDVVVDVMNRRFILQNVIPRTRSQYVIRQILQIVPLPKGHPVYNVPVDRRVML